MANEKISEYLTAYSATINDATLKFDVSHGILTKYLTGAELVTRLQSDISTIYTADSTLLGDRNVNLGAFNLGFTNGQVAFGTVSLGNEVVRILSAAGEDALQIDTDSSSNVIVVIDDGATGKVGFGHNSPTEGIHSTVNARFDAKILQNLTAAQSLSDIHFAKTSSNAVINQVTSAGAFPVFSAMRTRGTIAVPTALLSGDTVGQYVFTGHNGSTFTDVVQIKAVAKENYSTGNHGTELQFYTTPLTTGGPVQQMVLMENGNLAIGTASTLARLHVVGLTDGPSEDAMVIHSLSGNTIIHAQNNQAVGFGIDAPLKRIHISHSANSLEGMLIANPNGGTVANAGIVFGNNTSATLASAIFQNSSTNTTYAGAGSMNLGTFNNTSLSLVTNNTSKVFVAAGGNVGIGQASANGAMLALDNTVGEKLYLFDDTNPYGFGIQASLLQSFVPVSAAHSWGTGTSALFVRRMTLKAAGLAVGLETALEKIHSSSAIRADTHYKVGAVKVVGTQGAAVIDATDAASAITQLNALLARVRTHGLIA